MSKYALMILTACLLLGAVDPKQGTLANGCTVHERLREAFPDGEAEKAPIVLDIHSKRLLIAADQLMLQADGKVKLVGCAIARFPAPKGSGKAHRPTTIRCQSALITLERPIHAISDLGRRKIVSIELSCGVRLALGE